MRNSRRPKSTLAWQALICVAVLSIWQWGYDLHAKIPLPVRGIVLADEDFPRTASMKIKRNVLAEKLAKLDRTHAVMEL